MSALLAVGLTIFPFVPAVLLEKIFKKNVHAWYNKLDRPSWDPPKWVFGPIWAFLFTSMGFASYLIYRDGTGWPRVFALSLYACSLVLNSLGNPFFSLVNRGQESMALVMLACNVAACIWAYYPINKVAAYLMVPYLGWTTYISVLFFDIVVRNKDRRID